MIPEVTHNLDGNIILIFRYIHNISEENKHDDPLFSLKKLTGYIVYHVPVKFQNIFNFGKEIMKGSLRTEISYRNRNF